MDLCFWTGVANINKQKLHWTASYNPDYEGLSVRDIPLGYQPLSGGTNRKNKLIDLMSPINSSSPKSKETAAQSGGAGHSKLSQSEKNRRALAGPPSSTSAPVTTATPTAPANYTPPVAYDAPVTLGGSIQCRSFNADSMLPMHCTGSVGTGHTYISSSRAL